MNFMIWFQAMINIALPLFFLWRLYKADYVSKRLWIVEWISVAMFIGYLFVLSPWHIFIYYFRYLWLLLFILVSFVSYRRVRDIPKKGPEKDGSYKFSIGLSAVLAMYFGFLMSMGLTGYIAKDNDKAIELDFPLKNGVYSVGHGGSHTSINYHHSHPSQKYAYDILQINVWGLRAQGLTPPELQQYAIYESTLYSPCTGEVTAAVDQYEDIAPMKSESEVAEAAGNHVIITCKNAEVLIAHLKPNTVAVAEGEEVVTGDVIGEVGNTGNTTEPHLHIHAEKDGEGIPITFNGRFLKRNSLVFN